MIGVPAIAIRARAVTGARAAAEATIGLAPLGARRREAMARTAAMMPMATITLATTGPEAITTSAPVQVALAEEHSVPATRQACARPWPGAFLRMLAHIQQDRRGSGNSISLFFCRAGVMRHLAEVNPAPLVTWCIERRETRIVTSPAPRWLELWKT